MRARWLLVCGLGLAALLVWSATLPARTPPVFPEGDPAIIELYTWQASHGLWLYGPYSRFGWHHPGPLYFYLLAPFYIVSRHHTLALDAGALAINLAALAIAAWALLRFVRASMALAVLIALATYLYEIGRVLTSVWNPHVLLVPFGAFLITAAIATAAAARRAGPFPASRDEGAILLGAIALGSFVAQTHAGLLPAATAIAACLLAACLLGARARGQASWRWTWPIAAGTLALLLWLPTLIEQITASTGNLTAIAHFFGPSGPAGAGISFADAIAVWADALTSPIRARIAVPYGNAITITHGVVLPALALVEIVLLGLAAWHLHRRRRDTDAALALLCVVSSMVALVSIARIRGGLVDHLVGWVTLVGVINVGVLIGTVFTWIDERTPRTRTLFARAAAFAGVAVVAGVAWYGGSRIEFQQHEVVRKSTGGRTPTQALYQELRAAQATAHIRKPLIHAAVLSWPQAAGIALQLTKAEQPFASDLVWLFGPQVAPRGDEDADITVADTPTRHALTPRPHDCMLLERHGTSLHLLAEPPERFAALTCVAP